ARVFSGLELLPATVLASTLAMMLSFSLLKFWGKATQHRVGRWEIPWPTRWTFLSGLATALILLTTTLAYTFEGVSIPFVMLLMRGGVLLLAPIVDAITKRRVRWFSWIALFLSASALLDAVVSRDGKGIPLLCALDISLYLAGYFVRLRLMSKLGKSDDPAVNTRYFVEEQMVATPIALGLLGLLAVVAPSSLATPLRTGFSALTHHPQIGWALLAGLFSQGTGVFGGLVLLDARENSFCVPLNRAASILAGVLASSILATLIGSSAPSKWEIAGAAALVVAIGFLWMGPKLRRAQ
ncbi:MAG: hypothetical protein KBF88_07360, partial [Polyangiaceae bacterium]|nr:hypothetical protein [Polyangiaceae bacterium]